MATIISGCQDALFNSDEKALLPIRDPGIIFLYNNADERKVNHTANRPLYCNKN